MIKRAVTIAMITAMLAAAAAGFGAREAAAGEEGTVKGSAAWVGQGRVFQTGAKEGLFIGAFGGILYVESATGALDRIKMLCPGSVEMNLETGAQDGGGKCILTNAEGDNVFADWSCASKSPGGCEGSFTLTAGTGKLQGITGQSPLKARTAIREILVDLKSGAVAETGAGLLVLPELKYKLP